MLHRHDRPPGRTISAGWSTNSPPSRACRAPVMKPRERERDRAPGGVPATQRASRASTSTANLPQGALTVPCDGRLIAPGADQHPEERRRCDRRPPSPEGGDAAAGSDRSEPGSPMTTVSRSSSTTTARACRSEERERLTEPYVTTRQGHRPWARHRQKDHGRSWRRAGAGGPARGVGARVRLVIRRRPKSSAPAVGRRRC